MKPQSDPTEDQLKLTRKSPFTPTVRLCPKCLQQLQRGSRLGGWLIPQDYFCSNCGYKGTVFLEKDIELGSGNKERV